MTRPSFQCLLLIVLLTYNQPALMMIMAQPTTAVTEATPCSPTLSYQATQAIEEQIFEWAKSEFGIRTPDALPSDCELLPWKDVHYEHNSLREKETTGRKWYRCKKCSKQFKTAAYLDRHISSRHLPSHESNSQQQVCLAKFCSFIPCGPAQPTAISAFHAHHPERLRAAHLCRDVFAKCFPPSQSAQFKKAHEAMEAHYCQGKKRARPQSGGFSYVFKVLSWMVAVIVIGFYAQYFFYHRPRKPAPRGLGIQKRPQATANGNGHADFTPKGIRRKVISMVTPDRPSLTPQRPAVAVPMDDDQDRFGGRGAV